MKPLELAVRLFDHYESREPIQAYYGLLALYALARVGVEGNDEAAAKRAVDLLCAYPDRVEHPRYNFESYRVGGNGKGYILYHGLCGEQAETVRAYAEKTLAAPTDPAGITCRVREGVCQTWIDVAACVMPFMLYTGLYFKEARYIDFAAGQTILMTERFHDPETGLLHQTKGFLADPEGITQDHWGRGNGWGLMALATLAEHLPGDHPLREKAVRYYRELCTALLKVRNHKGVWRQELTNPFAWDESSATALFLYGFGVGLRTGLLDPAVFGEPFETGLSALCARFINPDFSTNMCCMGCIAPGTGDRRGTPEAYVTDVYPKTDEHHSFGAFMLALTEAHLNGIKDLGEGKWDGC